MALRTYQEGTREVDIGGPRMFYCDLLAERPASGLRLGDRAVVLEGAGSRWIAESETSWAADGYGPPGGTGATAPTGAIEPYAGDAAPSGYLLCDGAAVSRTTYAALFAVTGTKYGAGDGSTTFNVPNLKGRLPVGLDAAIPDFDDRGKTGGEKTHVLTTGEMPAHTHVQDPHGHALTDPGHTHLTQRYPTTTGGSSGFTFDTSMSGTLADNTLPVKSAQAGLTVQNATPTNQAAGGGGAHENMPPYVVVLYIIKT